MKRRKREVVEQRRVRIKEERNVGRTEGRVCGREVIEKCQEIRKGHRKEGAGRLISEGYKWEKTCERWRLVEH